jgi:hypothetical protein
MNYVPDTILARPVMAVIGSRIEAYIEQALRDFKSELEILDHETDLLPNEYRPTAELLPPNVTVGHFGKRQEARTQLRGEATGTFGSSDDPNANPVYGAPDNSTVDFTRPPEDNNLRNK